MTTLWEPQTDNKTKPKVSLRIRRYYRPSDEPHEYRVFRFLPSVLPKQWVIAKNFVGYAHGAPGNLQIFELS